MTTTSCTSIGMRTSLTEYAESFDSYAAAIEDVRRHGLKIGKYADPTEPERYDLTDEEAAEAGMDDISLLFIHY